jgi:hypothetical protein
MEPFDTGDVLDRAIHRSHVGACPIVWLRNTDKPSERSEALLLGTRCGTALLPEKTHFVYNVAMYV